MKRVVSGTTYVKLANVPGGSRTLSGAVAAAKRQAS